MHIISAKKGDVVYIGKNIRLVIGRLRSHGLEIGIEAPHEIPIRREEYQENTFNQACQIILKQYSKQKKSRHCFWWGITTATH